jgi:beta-galactosidase
MIIIFSRKYFFFLNQIIMKRIKSVSVLFFLSIVLFAEHTSAQSRLIESFDNNWGFFLSDSADKKNENPVDVLWRKIKLPHDWSIEGKFDEHSPATTGGGALTGGIGWYRKSFTLPLSSKGKNVFIDFDGVYLNSEVWINGHYLGIRPYGFSSFRYDLTPYLKFGDEINSISVKVDNSKQPNSRWYSGSGIYRNVWLVTANKIFTDHWGSFITTPKVNKQSATVNLQLKINNTSGGKKNISVSTTIYNKEGKEVAIKTSSLSAAINISETSQIFSVANPELWSIERPYLYKAVTHIINDGKVVDEYTTTFGIRYFEFDINKGFLLNGKHVKINGVCDHHDLGCLGSAINTRALERQLEILKGMGCNGIRTSHNPPAPELLELCDKMGFIVMDEAFDMWKKEKNPYDYHLHWDEWHKKDLEDLILRDRNHPSVFIWSIGNEIIEQWDSTGTIIGKELGDIVKSLDSTRPVTSALNGPYPSNFIYKSGALDLVGYNYDHKDFGNFPQRFPGKKFIGTETVSALETRGHYDMPSDSMRRWPTADDYKTKAVMNNDHTVSAYDNISAPWGSTHEETWKQMKKYDFLSGMYIWTGFDYIGEPTPYDWPSRSSYFGIIDLAGFPKDVYYMYQSEWTDKTMLYIFPHWNWKPGKIVDVWAYYNNADEVELFLNDKSLGIKKKTGDDLHVMWHVPFTPGTLKAISRKGGKIVLTKEIKTAGAAAKIILTADRKNIKADGKDLSFVTVKIVDARGNPVPDAENDIQFAITGEGFIAGVDNGSETSLETFKADHHKTFNGLGLAVIQSKGKAGVIKLNATSAGLQSASVEIIVK